MGVVLTIPAAGSEGSGNTVITKLEGLQKLSLRVPELLRPVFAVMNPELTYTCLLYTSHDGTGVCRAYYRTSFTKQDLYLLYRYGLV